jgi:hypothetical protein
LKLYRRKKKKIFRDTKLKQNTSLRSLWNEKRGVLRETSPIAGDATPTLCTFIKQISQTKSLKKTK